MVGRKVKVLGNMILRNVIMRKMNISKLFIQRLEHNKDIVRFRILIFNQVGNEMPNIYITITY